MMREEQEKLVITLEQHLKRLMRLHDKLKEEHRLLSASFTQKEEELLIVTSELSTLKTSFSNLKTAQIISINDNDFKATQRKLSLLIREVDKCISLLKE